MRGWRIFCLLAFLLIFTSSAALAEDLPVTSNFGWRVHPISGEYKFHSGVDLGYPDGTGILALFDGVEYSAPQSQVNLLLRATCYTARSHP